MISIDQALEWVTWAFFSGAALGLPIGVSVAFAVRWGESPPRSKRGRVRDVLAERGGVA